jgi:3-methyladenine DNA glycosylase/8-oxoguanine DNA glycosylase
VSWIDDLGGRLPRTPHARSAVRLALLDPELGAVVRRVGKPPRLGNDSTFPFLARVICHQQLSMAAARTIWGRVLDLFDGKEPDPRSLLRRRDATLRSAGLSRAKVLAVKDLARHVADGRLEPERLHALEDQQVIERMTAVRGFGVWSAQMHLIFSLGRLDVWPSGDLGVQKGLARLLGRRKAPTAREAEALGDRWKPHRTLAAWYLWRLLELPPEGDEE